jgi:hypothetical protein
MLRIFAQYQAPLGITSINRIIRMLAACLGACRGLADWSCPVLLYVLCPGLSVFVLQIDTLFITHLHGDHCFGIGTMLVAMCKAHKAATAAAADPASSSSSSSSSSSGYDSPSALRIVGPPRLGELVSTMLYIAGVGRQLDQPVYITEFVESERCVCDVREGADVDGCQCWDIAGSWSTKCTMQCY